MSKIGYLFAEGFKGIFKHGFMSFATITILIACLIIMGSVSLLSVNIDSLISDLEDQNEVVAFVDEEWSDEQAEALGKTVESLPNVSDVQFVTRTQAMTSFMSNYDSAMMEGIDESVFRNRYVIKLEDIGAMAAVQQALENIDGIVKVVAHLDYAESFITVRNIVRIVSIILIAMLVFVSFFIMSNTIKLATYSRKEEIGIMKMVGAGNTFIKMPFVIEGLILGILGAGIAFIAQWGIYNVLTEKVVSGIAGQLIHVVPFSELKQLVLASFLGIGVLVGAFGGVNAIRNYLKV